MSDALAGTGPLRPGELAHAAVMAAVCSAIAVSAVALPFAAGLAVLATVPMALLAYRHRLRVLGAAAVAGALVSFLAVGLGGPCVIALSVYIGGLIGLLKRHDANGPVVLVGALAAGTVFATCLLALLTVLSQLRQLIFDLVTVTCHGLAALVGALPVGAPVGRGLRGLAATLIGHWPVFIAAVSILAIAAGTMIGWWAVRRIFARLGGVPDVHQLDRAVDDRPVAPIPAVLRETSFRYPGTDRDAVGPLNLSVEAGEHLAVIGANGSGKTTLMLLLAGRTPTSGTLVRPGSVGLGNVGGTAVVLQHPETQVLGMRVADDVVWGLPPGTATDVDGVLAEVGLAGLGEHDTDGLSGGQLQRLAVAAALAREPRLLIADEITSMVDQTGRETLLRALAGLTRHRDMALVHITHYASEAVTADRILDLTGADDNLDMVPTAPAPTRKPSHQPAHRLLELTGVGYRYASGTPWASTALEGIDLVIGEGDGVLIHGLNGSGKSTLAWIMAGLLVPTAGQCLLDGRPVAEQVGAVAIAFQAARLQLLRGRVDAEIADAAGFDHQDRRRVDDALAAVGLEPGLASRRIDQLSGGQMRRVALAGLLARNPRALILDEPLAGLDAASARGLLELLSGLRRSRGLTVIVISHDFSGLEELCPRTLHLCNGTLAPEPTSTGGIS
ncbi:ABC transporter ATP-binding protein [Nocardia anaemiae]|uniref:ABC transporter ATP-binding protein n=1 Tax=Nocardia anaemiae TaxID=263910 RepID=UPI0007A481BA|nr:ABC transporter ATP-binding protein [Nocardia anaemiae]